MGTNLESTQKTENQPDPKRQKKNQKAVQSHPDKAINKTDANPDTDSNTNTKRKYTKKPENKVEGAGKKEARKESLYQKKVKELAPKLSKPKKYKDPESANRDTDRHIIEATTGKGVKIYYLDNIALWCFNRKRAMQIYSKRYAEVFAKDIIRKRFEFPHFGKIVKVRILAVIKKDLNPKFYIENVLEDDRYFIRAFNRKLTAHDYQKRQTRRRKIFRGEIEPRTEREIRELQFDRDTAKKKNKDAFIKHNQARDKKVAVKTKTMQQ